MTQAWVWTYLDAGGEPIATESSTRTSFPTQVDAETWLGESWQALADSGIDAVTLTHDGVVVYGPMSLQSLT